MTDATTPTAVIKRPVGRPRKTDVEKPKPSPKPVGRPRKVKSPCVVCGKQVAGDTTVSRGKDAVYSPVRESECGHACHDECRPKLYVYNKSKEHESEHLTCCACFVSYELAK